MHGSYEERLKEIRRILERLQSAPSIALASYEICQEDPAMISTIPTLASRAKQNNIIEKMLRQQAKAADTIWLPWQEELKQELDGEPNGRKIIVYVDYEGNKGKSFFANTYSDLHPFDTVKMNNGKTDNLRYFITKYENIRCVIFDFTRQTLGDINWQFIEELKDGKFVSHKYDCQMVTLERTPHIVCMMN